MKLAEYMRVYKLNDAQMGDLIGQKRETVCKYRLGRRVPALEIIAIIEKATQGAVSFRDFMKDEPSQPISTT